MVKVKVDPYHYPVIIVVAFLVGFVVAIGLGFRPTHERRSGRGYGLSLPPVVQYVDVAGFLAQ